MIEPYQWGGGHDWGDGPGFMTAMVNVTMGPAHPCPKVAWWHPIRRRQARELWWRAIIHPYESAHYRDGMAEAYRVARQPMPEPHIRRYEPFSGRFQ